MASETDAGPAPAYRYRTPAGTAEAEMVIKRSTFIGTAGPAADAASAEAFVARVRERSPDANHHAWAYRLGGACGQAEIGSSDDGEPGGTAGRPMLAILEGSGLQEIVVVGTRYFGGIKLGTGGLVRAYSAAAREALKALPVEERVLHEVYTFSVDYARYGALHYLLPQQGVRVEEEAFAEQVTLRVAVPAEAHDAVAEMLREATNGEVNLADEPERRRYYAEE